MTDAKSISNEKGLEYEVFIGLLSLISIIDLGIILVMPLISHNTYQVLTIIQSFLTIFFVLDFLYRLLTAQARSQYFFRDYGWADLLSCWPGYWLRFLRIFRLIKVFRLIKNYDYTTIFSEIIDNRPQIAIYVVVVLVVIVLQMGGDWVTIFESENPNANIKDGGDALWWAFSTITTVGYGERYPTTAGGRAIGIALMICGIAIISVFTGYISNSFLAPKKKKQKEILVEPSDPKTKIAEIKRMVEDQEKASIELKERLNEIEKML